MTVAPLFPSALTQIKELPYQIKIPFQKTADKIILFLRNSENKKEAEQAIFDSINEWIQQQLGEAFIVDPIADQKLPEYWTYRRNISTFLDRLKKFHTNNPRGRIPFCIADKIDELKNLAIPIISKSYGFNEDLPGEKCRMCVLL